MTLRQTIRVQEEDFDLGAQLHRMRLAVDGIGAIASFVGIVRDINDDRDVSAMTLEHYPAMTEKALNAIVHDARERWEIIDITIIHRVGTLRPTDQIVMVAVASGHRRDAFAACEFVMDYLKTKAPFWKKEVVGESSRWVESRVSDDDAAKRWEKM